MMEQALIATPPCKKSRATLLELQLQFDWSRLASRSVECRVFVDKRLRNTLQSRATAPRDLDHPNQLLLGLGFPSNPNPNRVGVQG